MTEFKFMKKKKINKTHYINQDLAIFEIAYQLKKIAEIIKEINDKIDSK